MLFSGLERSDRIIGGAGQNPDEVAPSLTGQNNTITFCTETDAEVYSFDSEALKLISYYQCGGLHGWRGVTAWSKLALGG